MAASSSSSKKRKLAAAPATSSATPAASTKAAFASQLSSIQASLASSSDLNPLADLLSLIASGASSLSSDAVVPALSLLVRTLVHLVQIGSLVPSPVNATNGLLSVPKKHDKDQPQEQVQAWLKQRLNQSVNLLCRVMVTHPKEKTRLAALNGLMELQRTTSEAISKGKDLADWSLCPWTSLSSALIAGRYIDEAGETQVQSELCEEVRATFILDYVEEYVDVKLALHRAIRPLLALAGAPRSQAVKMMLQLSNPPASKSAIKAANVFVPALSSGPIVAAPKAKAGKRAGSSKGRGRKITQDGDDSSEDKATDDESEEEEDLNWFSDSGDEAADSNSGVRQQQSTPQTMVGGIVTSRPRRRRSARSLPFHQALYDVKAWKVEINSVWLALLLSRSPKVDAQSGSDDGTLSLGEINAVLRVMEKKVLPYLTKPQLLADWLIDCIDVGSSTALLAMSPLYQLFTRYSLSLPSLYTTLYRLLTPSLLHSPHRSHSLRLLALFLSSEKLPLSILLAFCKRLGRCALRGPPGGIIPVTIIIYNLLKRHKEGMQVLHREGQEDEDGGHGWIDPFLSSLDLPPQSVHGMRTSLFEVSSLGATSPLPVDPSSYTGQHRPVESHYHAPTTTIVKILSQPFTKESYDLEEFLDHGYGTLLGTEIARVLGEEGSAQRDESKRKRTTRAPAVRFSLASNDVEGGAQGQQQRRKRVRVFPTTESEEGAVVVDGGGVRAVSEQEADDGHANEAEDEAAIPIPLDNIPDEELDEEELEAREAMREVQREQLRKAKEAPKSQKRIIERRDVMSLWVY